MDENNDPMRVDPDKDYPWDSHVDGYPEGPKWEVFVRALQAQASFCEDYRLLVEDVDLPPFARWTGHIDPAEHRNSWEHSLWDPIPQPHSYNTIPVISWPHSDEWTRPGLAVSAQERNGEMVLRFWTDGDPVREITLKDLLFLLYIPAAAIRKAAEEAEEFEREDLEEA